MIKEFNTKEISALKGWIEEYGFKHVNDRGKELVLTALPALEKIMEIEQIVDACENCIEYQGIKEYSETQAYLDILNVLRNK